jgi:hypothetical protein
MQIGPELTRCSHASAEIDRVNRQQVRACYYCLPDDLTVIDDAK